MKLIKLAIALIFPLAISGPVLSQSQSELVSAFSGDWYVFDPSHRDGTNPCNLSLGEDQTEGQLPASSTGCVEPISSITKWNVEAGQLVFLDAQGTRLAELGGNQLRLTGTLLLSELGVVAERASGDGHNLKISRAVQQHRCYFLGVSASCAEQKDLAAPAFPDDPPKLASVETLGNLAARGQPSREAATVGTIPKGTCVRVNQCLIASDGTWCQARFGESVAWLPKNAVRQDKWPIVTFANGCSSEPESN